MLFPPAPSKGSPWAVGMEDGAVRAAVSYGAMQGHVHRGAVSATVKHGAVQGNVHQGAVHATVEKGAVNANVHNGAVRATVENGAISSHVHQGAVQSHFVGVEKGKFITHFLKAALIDMIQSLC